MVAILNKICGNKDLELKPEEKFLIRILDEVEFVYDNGYSKSEYYRVNGEILFEQDSNYGWFWVHEKVWLNLEAMCGMFNRIEIMRLIQRMVWERLRKKIDTPSEKIGIATYKVWERLKTPTNQNGSMKMSEIKKLKKRINSIIK